MALYKGFRWDLWFEGAINSVLGAVSTTVVGYGGTIVVGEHPDFRVLGIMAGTAALWNFFSYIKDHLPKSVEEVEVKVTKTTTTTGE